MSTTNILLLGDSYGLNSKPDSTVCEIASFLSARGKRVVNLNLWQFNSTSQVYERSLNLLKNDPLLICLFNNPNPFVIFLLAYSLANNSRAIVFAKSQKTYQFFKAITSRYLYSYNTKNSEGVINTLKLFGL
jgi:hypothetical protein